MDIDSLARAKWASDGDLCDTFVAGGALGITCVPTVAWLVERRSSRKRGKFVGTVGSVGQLYTILSPLAATQYLPALAKAAWGVAFSPSS